MKLNIEEFDNVFTIFYIPIWVRKQLKDNKVNLIHLNENGEIQGLYLQDKTTPTIDRFSKVEEAFELIKKKVSVIDSLFHVKEAENFFYYAIKNGADIYTLNENLNFIPKAILMDTIKLNYKITNKRAKEITNILFSFTENIVSFSLYNKFLQMNLNPENGFLNHQTPSLIRDLTEIQRLKFIKKIHYLFESRFFEKRDLNRKHFPDTIVKFLKLLSTYFFYANKFKRLKEIFYFAELYKRGKYREIFSSL